MHLISIRNLRADAGKYPDAVETVNSWYQVVKSASWQNFNEVRQFYPTADVVGNFTIFNIKGNAYRLIVSIDYETQTVYYKYFLTHAEYDKEKWKNDPFFKLILDKINSSLLYLIVAKIHNLTFVDWSKS
jgi:mRNA interferase HigB